MLNFDHNSTLHAHDAKDVPIPSPAILHEREASAESDFFSGLRFHSTCDPQRSKDGLCFEPSTSPFRCNLELGYQSLSKTTRRRPWFSAGYSSRFLKGWRVVVFGSWFNILLLFFPAALAIERAIPEGHALVFIFCVLSLIPLTKLHDVATRELALRIGRSKTGLLNASLSNSVELVVAIIALQKCELRVVQTSLIGSILSKLLLVMGMCFFGGGLRFSEQVFDSTATQIHSSLLSLSVGAVLLPAAYHFSIDQDDRNNISDLQKQTILKMSHGVSVVLLFIYASYLVFQLWSHTHLYNDFSRTGSWPFLKSGTLESSPSQTSLTYSQPSARDNITSKEALIKNHYGLRILAESSAAASQPQLEKVSPNASSSSSSLDGPTIRVVGPQAVGIAPGRFGSVGSIDIQDASDIVRQRQVHEETGVTHGERLSDKTPQLSWFMTISLLTTATILVGVTADRIVASMDTVSAKISKEWIGLIVLPAVRAIAECVTAVNVSVKDQLTFSINLAFSSSIQTALFVIPFVVTLGWALNRPLALLFDPFESVVLYISVHTMGYIVADGKSNWLEGLILICLYAIIAIIFWFYPGSSLSASMAVCP